MKKMVRKTKAHKILDAVTALNKAMSMEEPHIRITSAGMGYGLADKESAVEFGEAIKIFVKAYKKYYMLEKVNLEISF